MVEETQHKLKTKSIECIITCFEDGSIDIKDKNGTAINGVKEQEFYNSCQCKEIFDIHEAIVDIKIVERDGTPCKVKKIGSTIYKIPCTHTVTRGSRGATHTVAGESNTSSYPDDY